ncbi:MAG: hypothetical protein ABIR11_14210 [Candidatus Limnocylindrales bacterium]
MRSTARPFHGRRTPGLAVAVVLALVVAACASPAPAADGPGATVQQALTKTAAKDLDGLRTLACAGQEDLIRNQLGLPGADTAGQLLPGVDTQVLLDAVTFDVTGVTLGQAAITGDTAEVPVKGSVKVAFDAATMRPILRQLLESQGRTMTDAQIDALLKSLEAFGQDIPVDDSVRLVREGGAWKICQDSIPTPAP